MIAIRALFSSAAGSGKGSSERSFGAEARPTPAADAEARNRRRDTRESGSDMVRFPSSLASRSQAPVRCQDRSWPTTLLARCLLGRRVASQVGDQVAELLRRERREQVFRHLRYLGGDYLVDVVSGDGGLFLLGVDQRERGSASPRVTSPARIRPSSVTT